MSINETLSNIGLGFVIFGCLLILFNNIFLWIKKDAEAINFLPGIFLAILGTAILIMLKFAG